MLPRFLIFLGFIMAPLYIGAGVILWLSEWVKSILNPAARILFGALFILYGMFRLFRSIKYIKDERCK